MGHLRRRALTALAVVAALAVTGGAPLAPARADAPPPLVVADDTATTDDVTGVDVDVLANDSGSGALTVDSVTQPADGTVTDFGDGTLHFEPVPGVVGDETFTYTVSDGAARTGTATVTVTVTDSGGGDGGGGGGGGGGDSSGDPVDDPDVAVGWDDTEGVLVDVLANDPDGATLDAVDTPAENGTATVEDGGIRYVPSGEFAGTDTFTYTIAGSDVAATVTVDVTAPDLVVTDDTATAEAAATPLTVDVLANDEGAGLTVTDLGAPDDGGSVELTDDGVLVTPDDGFRGTIEFSYDVTDLLGTTATGTVTVDVPNHAPVVTSPSARTVVAGGATTFTLAVSDPDPDDTDLVVVPDTADGSHGAADAVSTTTGTGRSGAPTVRVEVARSFSGTVTIPVSVEDGHDDAPGGTTLHLTVTPQPAVGLVAGAAPNPAARTAIGHPQFDRWGWPVSRQLSTQIDSRVTWQVSPTRSVTSYVVRVGGAVACTVTASPPARTRTCTLPDRALAPSAAVTVTALGAAGTRATAPVPVAGRTSAPTHLLAVVYLPAGRFTLDRVAQSVLLKTDALAARYHLGSVVVVGHTDSDGADAANLRLSRQRAAQVGAWLTAHDKRVRTVTSGRGESEPAMSNRTFSGKVANRRVEIWAGG